MKRNLEIVALQSLLFLKEVLFHYNGQIPLSENLPMKIVLRLLIVIQFSELLCFLFFFKFIFNHDKEMLQFSVISNDVYKRRKQDNAFSGFKQFHMFAYKFIYLILVLIIRLWGQKYFGKTFTICFTELMPLTLTVVFAMNSTLQLVSIRELRKKIF